MLELQHIDFEVKQQGESKKIIDDLSLTIEDSSFVVITGPNGSGKSTLAKIIMGIEQPTKGKIILDGKDITDLDVSQRANLGLSYAFQQPVKFKGLTVRDIISLAAGSALTIEEACVYLVEVGLCALDYVERELDSTLSGGELKRIEIATVLARGSTISIFDEPEAGIDLWSFHNLIKIFENIQAKGERNIIVISHQERILNIADRILVIEEGKIVSEGKKDDILPELLETADFCEFFQEAK